MTFTLTSITQRLKGGDAIQRVRKVAASQISVGRGADCDIQLQDLSVSLRHATLRQSGPDELVVEAVGREPFEVDGRFSTSATLSLNQERRLGFGAYTLTLSRGAEPGDVAVTVTRDGPASLARDPGEEQTFSIRSAMPGKRPLAWAFSLLILLLCIGLPIVGFVGHGNARIHADQQWSGEPLSQSHSFLGKNCQACHQKAFVAVRDEACLSCHRVGRDQADRDRLASVNRGWGGPVAADPAADHAAHARLLAATPLPPDFGGKVQAIFRRTFNHPNDRCASCHLEHIKDKGGATASAVSARAVPALVPTSTCADCHGKLRERVRDTVLKDAPDWSRHPEFRPVLTLSPGPGTPHLERVSWDGRLNENTGLRFSHQLHLSAMGGAARLSQELGQINRYGRPLECESCHRADTSGKGFAPVEMVRDCSSCHSLAYGRVGGRLQILPHGDPQKVVQVLRTFYESGGTADTAPPGSGRSSLPFLQTRLAALAGRPSASVQAANAIKAAFSPGGVCGECHKVTPPSDPASLNYRIAPVYLNSRYLPKGDFNHSVPAHYKDAAGRSTCTDCHAARTSDSADQVLIPSIARCATCHGKSVKQAPLAASADCTECHSYHRPGDASPKDPDQPHLISLGAFNTADATRP